jgi:hypothetical protein
MQKCLNKFMVLGQELASSSIAASDLYPARDALLREAKAGPWHLRGNAKSTWGVHILLH